MKLAFNFESFLSNVAVCTESGQRFTYEEVRDLANVATEPINCDDLVAIECINSIDSLVSYVGIIRRGIPAILIDQSLNESKRYLLYSHYQVSVVISNGVARRIARRGPPVHPNLALNGEKHVKPTAWSAGMHRGARSQLRSVCIIDQPCAQRGRIHIQSPSKALTL